MKSGNVQNMPCFRNISVSKIQPFQCYKDSYCLVTLYGHIQSYHCFVTYVYSGNYFVSCSLLPKLFDGSECLTYNVLFCIVSLRIQGIAYNTRNQTYQTAFVLRNVNEWIINDDISQSSLNGSSTISYILIFTIGKCL